jgi:hypothetical protein
MAVVDNKHKDDNNNNEDNDEDNDDGTPTMGRRRWNDNEDDG